MNHGLERDTALARILDAGAIGTWSWDRARDLLSLDARGARHLRLLPATEGFAGTSSEAFVHVHPADASFLADTVTEAGRRASRVDVELRVRGENGDELRWVLWAGAFLPQAQDMVGAGTCAGIVLDVTERRRSRDEVERALRRESIGLFAGSVSHDFNNILQTLGAHEEILRSGFTVGDPRAESAEEIRQAVERAAGLTQQLLTLSRRRPGDERLALVHADAGARSTIESLLGLFGYAVVVHENAQAALEAFERADTAADLVVADVASGGVLSARLRDRHPRMRLVTVPPGPIAGSRLLHEVRTQLDERDPGVTFDD